MKTELEALGFTGFYQGIWDQGENEYGAMQMLKDGDYDDIESLEFIEDWGVRRGLPREGNEGVCRTLCWSCE